MANEAAEPGIEPTPEQKIEEKLFGPIGEEAEQEAAPQDDAEILDPELEGDEAEFEEADEVEAADLFDIEIDNQVYEVPAALRDAIMRDEDYTQKTQVLAEDRQALEVVTSAVKQEQQQQEFVRENDAEIRKGEELNWQVTQLRQYMRDNIDSLTGNDLEKVRFQIDEINLQKNGIAQSLRAKYGEFQQATEQARKELRDKSTETLKARLPNWGDATEGQARAYALEIGFTDDEYESSIDPRERQVLWEASEYRRLKAGAKPAARKAGAAPKIRPKGRDARPKDVRRKISIRKRLNSATTAKAKARVIEDDVADRLGL